MNNYQCKKCKTKVKQDSSPNSNGCLAGGYHYRINLGKVPDSKSKFLLLLLVLISLNVFAVDTVFVHGLDTFKVLPNGYNAIDTNSYVKSVIMEVVDLDTSKIYLKSNNPKFIYKVVNDGSTLSFKVYQVGTSYTGDVEVELNNLTVVFFDNGNLQHHSVPGVFDSTLYVDKPDQFVVKSSDGGRVYVDCRVTHNETTFDTLVVISIEKSTSVLDNFNSNVELTLFPNPVTDVLNVQFDNTSFKPTYQIVDMNGQIILEDILIENSIDVSELKRGLYFVMVNNQIIRFVKE